MTAGSSHTTVVFFNSNHVDVGRQYSLSACKWMMQSITAGMQPCNRLLMFVGRQKVNKLRFHLQPFNCSISVIHLTCAWDVCYYTSGTCSAVYCTLKNKSQASKNKLNSHQLQVTYNLVTMLYLIGLMLYLVWCLWFVFKEYNEMKWCDVMGCDEMGSVLLVLLTSKVCYQMFEGIQIFEGVFWQFFRLSTNWPHSSWVKVAIILFVLWFLV